MVTAFVNGADQNTQVQLFSVSGATPTLVGSMRDDGQGGDQVAGDHVYTVATTITAPATASLPMQVLVSPGTSVNFSVQVVQIPPYTTDTNVNQAESQIYSTAIQTRATFTSPNWSAPSAFRGISGNLVSIFGQLYGVLNQNTGLQSAKSGAKNKVRAVRQSTSPHPEGIGETILNILKFNILSPAESAQSCDELAESFGPLRSGDPYPLLDPNDPRLVQFAQELVTLCSSANQCPAPITTDDLLGNDNLAAAEWALSYLATGPALPTPIAGCGGGAAQSLDNVAVTSEVGQFTDLAGDGLSSLAGGGQISQQIAGQANDILVGWVVDNSGNSSVVIGQAAPNGTFGAPTGTYDLAYSFGGDNANATVTNTPVYPNSTTNISPSPGANITVTPPFVTGFAPTFGTVGATVSIYGTGFDSVQTGNVVTFDGASGVVTDSTSSSIETTIPAEAISGPISVTTSSGRTTSSSVFTVVSPSGNPYPSISSLSPSSLSVGSVPQTLTINGSGFIATSTVTFNGIAHAPTVVSASQLLISLTASDLGTAGSFPVVVTNPQPGGGISNSVEFLVVNAPTGTVTISPQAVSVPEAGLQTFSATVAGGGEVTWSVEEGSQGGTITSEGVYAAPKTAGTFHVVATNAANSSLTATATVAVVPSLPVGTISTVAGGGFGCAQQTDSVGDGCPTNLAELVRPSGVATDQAGNIYISDTDTNRIRVVNTQLTAIVVGGVTIQPGTISAVVGNGSQGYSGDGGSPFAAELDAPGHLTLDGAGNIFVSDSYNHVVRLVNTQTTAITYAGVTIQPNSIATIAGGGTGCANQTDAVGDGCPAMAGQMDLPDGIALDRNNNLYIADFYGERIRRVDASTGVITSVAGDGYGGFSGDGGPATSAELYDPSRISADAIGNLYIADFYNNRLRRIDGATGIITTLAGTGNYGYSGDGGPAMNAELNPLSVVVDAAGNVFIADSGNQRIRIVNTQSTAIKVLGISVLPGDIQTVVGNGSTGYSGDGGPATSATIDGPTGLWFDRSGNLYFADSINGVIRKVTGP